MDCGGIVEVPVSQICRRGGGLRPFQICALSTGEMRSALHHASVGDHPVVTIVGHSFELASRDGRRVNALVRRRFDRLCAFLEEHRETMPTCTFAGLPPSLPQRASQPMSADPLRTARRVVEQAWGNARYERPAVAAAAAAAAALPAAALAYVAANGGL